MADDEKGAIPPSSTGHIEIAGESSDDPRRFLVPLHQCRVAHDIREHHGEKATLLLACHIAMPPSPSSRSMA